MLNLSHFEILAVVGENNSAGRLSKVWVVDTHTGVEYLVKSSTFMAYEPFSEVMASLVGKALGFPVADYYLEEARPFAEALRGISWPCRYVSICPRISPVGGNIVSVTHVKNELNGERRSRGLPQVQNTDVAQMTIQKSDFDQLLFFDALIGNKDRHWRNVHLISWANGTFSLAPYIDNGDSLLATDPMPTLSNCLGFNKSCTMAKTHDLQMKTITTIDTTGVNIEERIATALQAIQPVLMYMPVVRRNVVQKYLAARVRKYYGMFSRIGSEQYAGRT